MRNLGIVALCAALGGCVANASQTPPEEPLVWGRVDCVRLADNPMAQQEFEQAKAICLSRGQAAAVAGTAGMPGGRGLGGAIIAGANQGAAANQIGTATISSCMGEQGYLFKTKTDHLAMCEAIREQKERIALATAPQKRAIKPASRPPAAAPAVTPQPTPTE
jgi:hypothetical protein